MENFKKFELKTVWKKQVMGGSDSGIGKVIPLDDAKLTPQEVIPDFREAKEEDSIENIGTIQMYSEVKTRG